MKTLESRLRHARMQAGYTQKVLAEKITDHGIKCAPKTVSAWEREQGKSGKRTLPINMLPIIAQILNTDIRWIVTGSYGVDDTIPDYRVLYLSKAILEHTTAKQRRGLELLLGFDFPLENPVQTL